MYLGWLPGFFFFHSTGSVKWLWGSLRNSICEQLSNYFFRKSVYVLTWSKLFFDSAHSKVLESVPTSLQSFRIWSILSKLQFFFFENLIYLLFSIRNKLLRNKNTMAFSVVEHLAQELLPFGFHCLLPEGNWKKSRLYTWIRKATARPPTVTGPDREKCLPFSREKRPSHAFAIITHNGARGALCACTNGG